ncbi:hypothetical protein CRG98_021590 [Punica granatum]|uniref:F-box domain-containing protein n=1 Tax=Punica granatum TaxID=22663 RepID=A0A2I0JQ40_PUNGR|nr:hypothetical protein CRG98_021590 [Punica granatum]
MEKSSSQSSNTFLPQEIIWDILLRLPVRSLCRFRCVSTLWRSIISDPQFVSSHFARSSAHPKLLFTVNECVPGSDGYIIRMVIEGLPIIRLVKGKFFFSADYPQDPEDLVQVSSSHGRISTTGFTISQSENFRAIPFPEEYEYDARRYLMEFGGRAALVDYHAVAVEGLGGEIRLWILKDAQNQVWSCKTVTPSLQLGDTLSYKPLCVGVTHEGELIFAPPLYMGPFHCYLYHVENATFRKVEIRGLYERIIGLRCLYDDKVAVSYHVESLQSLRDIRFD